MGVDQYNQHGNMGHFLNLTCKIRHDDKRNKDSSDMQYRQLKKILDISISK